jgi:hypothetical protein
MNVIFKKKGGNQGTDADDTTAHQYSNAGL